MRVVYRDLTAGNIAFFHMWLSGLLSAILDTVSVYNSEDWFRKIRLKVIAIVGSTLAKIVIEPNSTSPARPFSTPSRFRTIHAPKFLTLLLLPSLGPSVLPGSRYIPEKF